MLVKKMQDYQAMDKEQSRLFLMAVMLEEKMKGFTEEQMKEAQTLPIGFLGEIIKKRIEVLKLPIKFTDAGLFAAQALIELPGHAVVLLIDALTEFEGKTVGVKEVSELYPWGFYKQEVFEDYIDNKIKPKKVKWAEIY